MDYTNIELITRDENDEKVIEIKTQFENLYKTKLIVKKYSSHLDEIDSKKKYFLYLSDDDIKSFLKVNIDKDLIISILPNEFCESSILRYGISQDIIEVFEDIFNDELRVDEDFLICNDQVVFKKVSIGNIENLGKKIHSNSIFKSFKILIESLKKLKYKTLELETAKNNKIATVASGILVLEDYTIMNYLKNLNNSSFNDGKLNAFIMSPNSLFSYFYQIIVIFLHHKFSIGSLPNNIGFISSSSLHVKCEEALDFLIDDIGLSAKEIELKVIKSKISINYGRKFLEIIQEKNTTNEDENINMAYLPKGEIEELLISGKVPLLHKASDEDMKDTLTLLRDNSKTSSIFIILMILSTLLATVGLFQDSTPSVIGAMILAPLMAPIISLSMGVTRSDNMLTQRSIKTLGLGIISALIFSSLLTLLIPLDIQTSQMSSRVHPNLLDLFVAIFSGIAGAYASSKEEVAKSLAGVAIAVALVPPLAVVGIGIGWGDLSMILGSSLLFLTNLFGMILSASLTFLVLGFAPIHRAKKGIIYSTIILLFLSIPLYFSFQSLISQSNDYDILRHLEINNINTKNIKINILGVNNSTKNSVDLEIEIISKQLLGEKDYELLKANIAQKLNKDIILTISPKIVK